MAKNKMVKAKEKSNVTTTTATVDKVSLCIVITTVIIILLVVVAGVCVRFLLEESLSRVILIGLICFLFVLGILVLIMLEVRRRATRKNNVVTVRNGAYHSIQPSAPQDTSWEYTHRATVPA